MTKNIDSEKELPNNTLAGQDGEQVVQTFCAMCSPAMGCGVNCYVKDGRFTKIRGMKESPVNRGKLCRKSFASMQWVYSPQRLKYPLKRIGKKGESRFEKITWDEAVSIIASKLKEQKEKYGPESLAVISPQQRNYKEMFMRFMIVHGSPNYGHSGICAIQRAFGFAYTLGTPRIICDYDHTDLILIWGANPFYDGPRGDMKKIYDAKKRGARVVLIKPRLQTGDSTADLWIPVRPGTDGALALAMLNVIIREQLYDKDFISKWCYGFDQLVPHIQQYTPEWAEPITGLPAKQIRDLTHLYGNAESACILAGNAFDQTVDSSNAVRAVAILMAVCGNFDRPGGNIAGTGSTMPAVKSLHPRERYAQDFIDRLVGPEITGCFQPFIEGISSAYYKCLDSVLTQKPYPIRTIIAPGTQPTVSTRNPGRVIEALRKLEFFVVIDVMENSAMPWADIVIPVTTMYECGHPFEAKDNWIMARNKVIEPLGGYKSDFEFWLDLAVQMGYGDDFWHGSIEDCMNYQLENFGMTMDELRKHPGGIIYEPRPMVYEKYEKIFSTPSPRFSKAPYLPQGKVAIYNTLFEQNGFNPLPEWVEGPETPTGTPELLPRYPLMFTDTHSSKAYTQGWLRNIPDLRKVQPEPILHIHPETAKVRGIENGNQVMVESPHGRLELKAVYCPDIRADVVMSLHGWWQDCEELGLPGYPLLNGGANVNLLYSTDPEKAYDPLVTAMPKQTLVEVRKAG